MGLFNNKIQIGKGQKYDLTEVTNNEVTQEEATKNKNKLIQIFNAFDKDKSGTLDSNELAKAFEFFTQLDANEDMKLSDKELKKALETFNGQNENKEKIKVGDLKNFLKNILDTTQKHEKTEVDVVRERYEQEQKKIERQNFLDELDKSATQAGLESTSTEEVYKDPKTNLLYKYDAESKTFKPAKLNESTQKYEFMTAEEIAAAQEPEVHQEEKPKAEETQLHSYTVQNKETFTEIIIKSLKAQGIENPTEEQIKAAKDKFKENNPNAVKTTSDGYEYLLVGAKVKLEGELEDKNNAAEQNAAWAEDNPELVWKPNNPLRGKRESSELEEVVVVASRPTEEQKVRGQKAKELGLDSSAIDGFYKKYGPDGNYEYYIWDADKKDFVSAKSKGIISVTEPNQYTDKYVLRRAVEGGGYNDEVYSKDKKLEKTLQYDKDNKYIGYVEYIDDNGIDEHFYNAKGQETKCIIHNQDGSLSRTENYTYDPKTGKKIQEVDTYPDGNAYTYTYDPQTGKMIQEVDTYPDGKSHTNTYDPQTGKKIQEVDAYPDGRTETYTFDAEEQMTKRVNKDKKGNIESIFNFTNGKGGSYISQRVDSDGNPIGEPIYYDSDNNEIDKAKYDELQK